MDDSKPRLPSSEDSFRLARCCTIHRARGTRVSRTTTSGFSRVNFRMSFNPAAATRRWGRKAICAHDEDQTPIRERDTLRVKETLFGTGTLLTLLMENIPNISGSRPPRVLQPHVSFPRHPLGPDVGQKDAPPPKNFLDPGFDYDHGACDFRKNQPSQGRHRHFSHEHKKYVFQSWDLKPPPNPRSWFRQKPGSFRCQKIVLIQSCDKNRRLPASHQIMILQQVLPNRNCRARARACVCVKPHPPPICTETCLLCAYTWADTNSESQNFS